MSNSQSVMFETPPSEYNVANVISSQPKALYLNKPKYHKEEEDTTAPLNPETNTSEDGNTPSSEPTHDWQKRYSDLKSYHDRQIHTKDAELAEKVRILAEKDTQLKSLINQPVKLPSTPAEVEEFKSKYSALYNIIETIVLQNNFSTKAEFERAVKENEGKIKELTAEKARAELLKVHPDAMSLKSDPGFVKWYEEQVPFIKSLIESVHVQDVARGLDIYKKDVGLITKSKAQKDAEDSAAAMSVTTRSAVQVGREGGKIWKASEVKRIPMSQYRKYESEILKAVAEGRYDENN